MDDMDGMMRTAGLVALTVAAGTFIILYDATERMLRPIRRDIRDVRNMIDTARRWTHDST